MEMIYDILLNVMIQHVAVEANYYIYTLVHKLISYLYFFRIEQYTLTLVALVDRRHQKSVNSFARENLK